MTTPEEKKAGERTNRRVKFFLNLFLSFVLGMIPLIFLFFGIREFAENYRALSWKTVSAKVLDCTSTLIEDRDEEEAEVSWQVEYTIKYEYVFEGKTHENRFHRRSSSMDKMPQPDEVASLTKTFFQSIGDGLTANVNPADPTQALVEPTIVPGILLTLLGLVLSGVMVWVIRLLLARPEEEDDSATGSTAG